MERAEKLYKGLGITAFILLLLVLLLHILLPDQTYSETEKRSLQTFPKLSLASLTDGSLTDNLDSYAADQFPERNLLMKIRMNLSSLLGKRESNGVFLCRDGSLMEEFAEYDEENLRKITQEVSDFVKRNNFEHSFLLLSPTAVSEYSERLPLMAETGDEKAWMQRFLAELPEEIEVLDTEPVYAALKAEGREIFYVTDHHWRTETAYEMFLYYADQCGWNKGDFTPGAVTEAFSGSLVSKSGFTPRELDEVTIYTNNNPDAGVLVTQIGGDYSSVGSFYHTEKIDSSNPYEVFFGGNDPVLQIQTTADTNRTLLVLKDSYANCFIPFLAESYKTICVIDPRYTTDSADSILMGTPYTDLLILYNANTLSQDENLSMVLEKR